MAQNADDRLEKARAAAKEARTKVAELETAIINGDPKTTIAQLESQESKARFAELQIKALELQLEREAAAELDAEIQSIRSEVEAADLSDAETYVRALHAVEDAVLTFREAVEDRHEQLTAWRRRLRKLGVQELSSDQNAPAGTHGIAPIRPTFSATAGPIRLDDTTYGPITADEYIADVLNLPTRAIRDRTAREDVYDRLRRQVKHTRKRGAE